MREEGRKGERREERGGEKEGVILSLDKSITKTSHGRLSFHEHYYCRLTDIYLLSATANPSNDIPVQ